MEESLGAFKILIGIQSYRKDF